MILSTQDWSTYPMGPNMRRWLEIQEYKGDQAEIVSSNEKRKFLDYLLQYSQDQSIETESELINLADELLAMDFPLMVLKLIDNNLHVWKREDFRALHTESLACIYSGELGRAEYCLRLAQSVAPIEPAPYVNLVQILQQDERWEEALPWLETGLKNNPNHFPLWELFYEYLSYKKMDHLAEILKKSKELNSWAGYSFFADIDPNANQQTKASCLDPFYKSGERGIPFLVEYTGALGVAGDYEKIPMIVWESQKLGPKLDWQLSMHCAQSHLAMNQKEAFFKMAKNLINEPLLPRQAKDELINLMKEVEED